jgi:hypothetical protein
MTCAINIMLSLMQFTFETCVDSCWQLVVVQIGARRDEERHTRIGLSKGAQRQSERRIKVVVYVNSV